MHQYKIEIINYKENGSLGELFGIRYADNPEQAKAICNEYEKQMQVNEEGVSNGMKAFKVNLYLLCYKLCTDKQAFFAQFEA